MLTSKQRATLSSMANDLDAIFQVGKGNVNDNMINQINEALEKRELIKITVLQNCEGDVREVANTIAELTKGQVVKCIGKKIILYKESKNNKTIML